MAKQPPPEEKPQTSADPCLSLSQSQYDDAFEMLVHVATDILGNQPKIEKDDKHRPRLRPPPSENLVDRVVFSGRREVKR